MSISTEIQRLSGLRDDLRAKLIEMVLLTDSAADLEACVSAVEGIVYRGEIDSTISVKNQTVNIPAGYHNGNGSVAISATEQAKIIASNIKTGLSILGVTGTFTSDGTAAAGDVREGKIVYVNGSKITGTIPDAEIGDIQILLTMATGDIVAELNYGAGYYAQGGTKTAELSLTTVDEATVTPTTEDITAVKANRYTLGAVTVKGDANLVAGNIRSGITIFGVTGNFTAGDALATLSNPATAEHILSGKQVYADDGAQIVGTMTDYSDVEYFSSTASNMENGLGGIYVTVENSHEGLNGYVNGVTAELNMGNIVYTVLDGNADYLSSMLTGENPYLAVGKTMLGGAVVGTYTSDADAVAANIVDGKTAYVNGEKITGTLKTQTKTVTPTTSQQSITPDSGYHSLSSVTVNAIPTNYKDISVVTAEAAHVLAGKIFVAADGTKTAGTMTNRGAIAGTIDGLVTDTYTVAAGYHNGSGTVKLTSSVEEALAAI